MQQHLVSQVHPITQDDPMFVDLLQMNDGAVQTQDGFLSLSLVNPDTGERITLLAEPFSWSALALEIAKGVLSGLAGKVFVDLIFGKVDLAEFGRKLIELIEIMLKSQLQAEAKRRVEAQLTGLNELYVMYSRDPNQEELSRLKEKAVDIVNETHSLGLQTIPSFAVVGGLTLSILQERYKRSGSQGARENLVYYADELAKKVSTYPARLKAFNESRFGPLICLRAPGSSSLPVCIYKFEGQSHYAGFSQTDGAPKRQAHIDAEYNRLEKELLVPLNEVAAQWELVATKYRKKVGAKAREGEPAQG